MGGRVGGLSRPFGAQLGLDESEGNEWGRLTGYRTTVRGLDQTVAGVEARIEPNAPGDREG